MFMVQNELTGIYVHITWIVATISSEKAWKTTQLKLKNFRSCENHSETFMEHANQETYKRHTKKFLGGTK
jgi:hypothetical protein